jgi:hypothetical protein
MVKTAFHDTTDTLPVATKGGWAKMGVRRLFHYAIDIMAKVYAKADSSKKDFWKQDRFIEGLGRALQPRRVADDTSPFILWRTDEKRCIRYEHLKAMIVGGNIHRRTILPTRKRKITTSFDFCEVEDSNRPRDTFFKWLGQSKGTYQLNEILLGRICFCIWQKHTVGKNHNNPNWKVFYPYIRTEMGLNLGIFWETTYRFEKAMKEFHKRKSIEKGKLDRGACELNSGSWRYPPSGGIYPFEYSTDVEAEMDMYLDSRNSTKAIEFALAGHLTERFLKWMVAMKTHYNSIRGSGDNDKALFLKHANL